MKYYIICDNTNRILAIHKVADSACACFQRMAKSDDTPQFLSLTRVETNDAGVVQKEFSIITFSKASGAIFNDSPPVLT
jgi:hypothetical protein